VKNNNDNTILVVAVLHVDGPILRWVYYRQQHNCALFCLHTKSYQKYDRYFVWTKKMKKSEQLLGRAHLPKRRTIFCIYTKCLATF